MTGAALDARVRVDRGAWTLDATVRAQPGDVVAVMGPSGAGKSTLFGALAGTVPIASGRVLLDGTDAAAGRHARTDRRGVIMLGQRARLFPHLSARDNVAFGLRAHGTARRTAGDEADGWLERVGLAGFGDRRPARLSGGQQQRVALARALAVAPGLLLLDEPLTSLDPGTADGIRALLREQLAATGTTTLIATHDAVDAASLAAELVVLEAGRVTQSGPVRDVLAAPATAFVAGVARAGSGMPQPEWRARVEAVETGIAGVRARARTTDGAEIVMELPTAAGLVPGATVAVHPPSL